MSDRSAAWGEGARILEERIAEIPEALSRVFAEPAVLPFDLASVRAVRTTGVGSSAAHARFLAHLLTEYAGLPAHFVPLGEFACDRVTPAGDELLVVFSQGLSPNARFALRELDAWHGVALVTAVDEKTADADRVGWLRALRERGGARVGLPAADEYGTLLRVVGPMLGFAVATGLARCAAERLARPCAALAVDVDALCDRVRRAGETLDAALGGDGLGRLDRPLTFLAVGAYAQIVDNLRYKVLEGLLRPAPPVWDLLHFVHGPYQQAWAADATFLALTCANDAGEAALLDRLEGLLDPDRHALLRLPAAAPAPLAIFEHEALCNALVLRGIAAEGIDAARWPGRGRDGPLYDLAPASPKSARAHPRPSNLAPRFEERTWMELDAWIAKGARTAVLALGATEQHGPHLPLATDTWIADALARRFCARVPDAIALPTLAVGCSSEHGGFAGTLDLQPETFAAVLRDLLTSLRGHGFQRAFVFSAHGGNLAPLRAALPMLCDACRPMQVIAATDLLATTRAQHAASARHGVDAGASGHHAGEFETSIVGGLVHGGVRADRLAKGELARDADAQALFYPQLRANAPSGVVGDPRSADSGRAGEYLDAWTDLLVAGYRRELPARTRGADGEGAPKKRR